MKYLSILFLVLASCASKPKIQEPFLWAAEKEGKKIYFFGTMRDYVGADELPPSVFRAMESSDIVVFEAFQPPFKVIRDYHDSFVGTLSLKQKLTPTSWEKYVKSMQHITHEDYQNLSPDQIESLHPYIGFTLLFYELRQDNQKIRDIVFDQQKDIFSKNEYQRHAKNLRRINKAMDETLIQYALDRQFPIEELDEYDEKFRAKFIADYVEKLQLLLQMNYDTFFKTLLRVNELAGIYRKGVYALEEYDYGPLPPEVDSYLIEYRNQVWLQKLNTWLNEHDCFVAVSLPHLYGEKSLLEDFRKQNFKVYRVSR